MGFKEILKSPKSHFYKGGIMENLNEYIHIRVSRFEKNRLKHLADKYAEGNISLWVIYASLNMQREFITPEKLQESKRNRVRGRKTRPQ